jgi:hypothetical protein
MTGKKSLEQREKELRSLIATSTGQKEIQELASRYHAASGRLRPARTSLITYILVHERAHGLIAP